MSARRARRQRCLRHSAMRRRGVNCACLSIRSGFTSKTRTESSEWPLGGWRPARGFREHAYPLASELPPLAGVRTPVWRPYSWSVLAGSLPLGQAVRPGLRQRGEESKMAGTRKAHSRRAWELGTLEAIASWGGAGLDGRETEPHWPAPAQRMLDRVRSGWSI